MNRCHGVPPATDPARRRGVPWHAAARPEEGPPHDPHRSRAPQGDRPRGQAHPRPPPRDRQTRFSSPGREAIRRRPPACHRLAGRQKGWPRSTPTSRLPCGSSSTPDRCHRPNPPTRPTRSYHPDPPNWTRAGRAHTPGSEVGATAPAMRLNQIGAMPPVVPMKRAGRRPSTFGRRTGHFEETK